MKLSRTYISSIDKYIHYMGTGRLFVTDGMVIASNNISLIVFTPDGDGEHIESSDFDGMEVEE